MPKEYHKESATFQNDVFKTCTTIATALATGIGILATKTEPSLFEQSLAGIGFMFLIGFIKWSLWAYKRTEEHLEELKKLEQLEKQTNASKGAQTP